MIQILEVFWIENRNNYESCENKNYILGIQRELPSITEYLNKIQVYFSPLPGNKMTYFKSKLLTSGKDASLEMPLFTFWSLIPYNSNFCLVLFFCQNSCIFALFLLFVKGNAFFKWLKRIYHVIWKTFFKNRPRLN